MIVASVLVARAVGPSEFGVYSAVMAMGTVIVAGSGGGLGLLGLRRVAQNDFDDAFLRRIGLANLVITLCAAVVVLVLAQLTLGIRRSFLLGGLCGLAFVAFSATSLASGFHSGARNFGRAALGEGLSAASVIVLTIIALAVGLGVGGAILAFGLGTASGAVFLWWRLPKRAEAIAGQSVSPFRIAQVVPFLALGLAAGGYLRLDTMVVAAIAESSVVGYYAAAYRFLGVFNLLGSAFGTVFFSRLSQLSDNRAEWQRVRRQGTLLFILAVLPLLAVLFLSAPVVIRALYGQRFGAAVAPARWLLLSVIPYCLYWPSAHALNSSGYERRWTVILVGGCLIDTALVVLLVPYWGASGAAMAWLAAELGVLVATILAVRASASRA